MRSLEIDQVDGGRWSKRLKIFLILILCTYAFFAILSTFTTYESIDECGLDYWSTRMANQFFDPAKAMKLEPLVDKEIGYIGFIRSGHFVYNKSLDQIANGEGYAIAPMVHFVPLYVHAFFKILFTRHIFYFAHVFFILMGVILPVFFYLQKTKEWQLVKIWAVILLLTPGILVNATYSMTDSVGLIGISIFCYCFFREPQKERIGSIWPISCGLILGTLLAVFYKPIGWIFLPWCLLMIILKRKLNIYQRFIPIAAILILTFGVTQLSKQIYSSLFWAGYHNPINQFLKQSMSLDIESVLKKKITPETAQKLSKIQFVGLDRFKQDMEKVLSPEETRQSAGGIMDQVKKQLDDDAKKQGVFKNRFTTKTNIFYGIPALFLAFPLMIFLLISVGKDLWKNLRGWRGWSMRQLWESDLLRKGAFLSTFVFFFVYLMVYSHSTPLRSYLSLSNPSFRYFMIPFIILVWYILGLRLKFEIRRVFIPLIIFQIFVLLVFPNNVIQRAGFRIYSLMLRNELHKVVPANAILIGANKYEKYFGPDEIPSYSFLAHQRYYLYRACFQNEKYKNVLGDLDSILPRVNQKNLVPILIFPDYELLDSATVLNPYQDLNYEIIGTIRMEEKIGWLGRFLPEDKKVITVARLIGVKEKRS